MVNETTTKYLVIASLFLTFGFIIGFFSGAYYGTTNIIEKTLQTFDTSDVDITIQFNQTQMEEWINNTILPQVQEQQRLEELIGRK